MIYHEGAKICYLLRKLKFFLPLLRISAAPEGSIEDPIYHLPAFSLQKPVSVRQFRSLGKSRSDTKHLQSCSRSAPCIRDPFCQKSKLPPPALLQTPRCHLK